MKIIFLDFDGVLNEVNRFYEYFEKYNSNTFVDPKLISNLNEIIKSTDAKVVISSTWREIFSIDELKEILKTAGFVGEVIDITPMSPDTYGSKYVPRGQEIQRWLNKHKNKPIESFVILDDTDDMLHLMPWLVLTDFNNGGLQKKHIKRAIKILHKKAPQSK